MIKKYKLILFYFISLIYMEIVLKSLLSLNFFSISTISMLCFIFVLSIILTLITSLFNEKIEKIILITIITISCVLFSATYVMKAFFGFHFTLSALGLSDQIANGFLSDTFKLIIEKLLGIIVIFLPLILALIFKKKLNFEKNNKKEIIYILCTLVISICLFIGSIFIKKNSTYSTYNLLFKINNVDLTVEKLGYAFTFDLDLYREIFGFESKVDNNSKKVENEIEDTEDKDEEYKPNIIGTLDMESLSDDEIINYLLNNETYQNEYTGIFKDKNLILILAESFSSIAVSEELTPTLYKLVNNGFVFDNFYTPTIYSTIGGEYQELTGLYADSLKSLSTFRSSKNYFPMGIGTMFKNEGYSVRAFHDSTTTFQNRNKYLKNMGFDYFEGCNTKGTSMKCDWPGSDVDMINATYSHMVREGTFTYTDSDGNEQSEKMITASNEKFFTYYVTVSGHGSYTASSKYYKKYKDLINEKYPNAPVESKSYIAGQMELDRALERLLEILKESGQEEDTVIALVGDHAPYYLYEKSMKYINAISDYERDSKISLFKSNLIIYNAGMETTHIEKVGTSIDVMPTLYNLFGLEYDSRLFIGKDILSTEPGLSIMADKSWVSDEGYYISSKNKFVQTSDNELEDGYVDKINEIVNNKVYVSNKIISENYYEKIFDTIKE